MLIDTHCHFNHKQLETDVAGCLERALEAGVSRMIVVGYDRPSSEEAAQWAAAYPTQIFASLGIHPHDAKHWDNETLAWLRDAVQNPAVVAIGEIGLDFHYDFSPRPEQYRAFREQLALAKEVGLPFIIHCREAYPELLEVLEAEGVGEAGGVMHCWAGSVEEAQRSIALGLHLGFGGTLTFKNAEGVRESARTIPLERILLETDAPYLAPIPHRGKRNEPAYTRLVAEKMAEVRTLSLQATSEATTQNALALFSRLA